MKSLRWTVLVVMLAAAALAFAADDKPVTLEGTLVDSACYLKGGETGNDHGGMKDCGTMCLKGGTPGGVLTKDKKFHAVIAPSTALAPHVGKAVRVTGTEHNGSLLASKVEVQKNGKWEPVKLSPMM
jgi:hypothetical protein